MRINETSNNKYTYNSANLNFSRLIKDNSAIPVIKNMSEKDKAEFKQIEKRLSKTKFWDMKISSVGNMMREFKFKFIHKKGKHDVITDGIYPYSRDGNIIKFYSIVYGPENTSFNTVEELKFKTEEKAENLYESYRQNIQYLLNRRYDITPLESIKIKEVELNMLEEASKNLGIKSSRKKIATNLRTKDTTGNDLSDN